MAPSSSSSSCVFENGNYKVMLVNVESQWSSPCFGNNYIPPPKPLLVATPSEEVGEYPLLLLIHGYLLYNTFYSQLIKHIASHGFIVIAPQLYTVAGPDSTDEIKSTVAITNWVSKGSLDQILPLNVHPNLTKVGLAGHSRGGKVAFALALGKISSSLCLKISALIGIDPVDGMDMGNQTPPPVLTYVPNSFDLNMAAMVIGSGLGEVKRNPLFPPCAPKGVNHENFYNECCRPKFYFVAKEYGHLDMLDDETSGIRGRATYCLCKNGKSREPMRSFVGGISVSFLKAYLEGDFGHLLGIRDGTQILPLELQKDEFHV